VVLASTELPLNSSSFSTVPGLQDDDEQRLMVIKSAPDCVSKNLKERLISAVEEMSHEQLASSV
jgi:hypothetical protein